MQQYKISNIIDILNLMSDYKLEINVNAKFRLQVLEIFNSNKLEINDFNLPESYLLYVTY